MEEMFVGAMAAEEMHGGWDGEMVGEMMTVEKGRR